MNLTRYFPPAKERDYTVYGYLCHYKGEPYADELAQLRALQAFNPQHIVYDFVGARKAWQKSIPQARVGLHLLLSGLLPGDIVVVSSLDRLGATLEEQYKAFLLLAHNEIRVHDMDPEGIYEWRAPWERGLAALVRRNAMAKQREAKRREVIRKGMTYRGVGWQPMDWTINRFVPFEPGRIVARRAAELAESGLSDEAVSRRLVDDRVMFLGAAKNDVREFTPELVRLCVDAVRDDFPWPESLMVEE